MESNKYSTIKLRIIRTCIYFLPPHSDGMRGPCTKTCITKTHRIRYAIENKCYREILQVGWTDHRTNQSITGEIGVTSGTLLIFFKVTTRGSKLFRTYQNTPNTGEINPGRKSERPEKQMKVKEILGEGCGGLDGSKCRESGTNTRRAADVQKIHQGSNDRKRIRERERNDTKQHAQITGTRTNKYTIIHARTYKRAHTNARAYTHARAHIHAYPSMCERKHIPDTHTPHTTQISRNTLIQRQNCIKSRYFTTSHPCVHAHLDDTVASGTSRTIRNTTVNTNQFA